MSFSRPTTSNSRKSSVTSRPHPRSPLPPSLRIPSIARRISNTQLSFVFAQGDSAARSDALKSEDQLSKQLDGDSGGKQMGLRSRRSSSATVRTVRTVSGLRSPSPDHASVMEVEEDDSQPVAGPSSPRTTSDNIASSSPRRQPSPPPPRRILNPKTSSSWLRWNSPTPSFPRSPSMNKGKGKAKELVDDVTEVDSSNAQDWPSKPLPSTVPPPIPSSDSIPQSQSTSPQLAPADPTTGSTSAPSIPSPLPASIVDPHDQVPPSTTKSRGWWGRSTPVQPTQRQESHKHPESGPPRIEPPLSAAEATASAAPAPEPLSAASAISQSMTKTTSPDDTASASPSSPTTTTAQPISSSVTTDSNVMPAPTSTAPPVGQGWKVYLGWGSSRKDSDTKTGQIEDIPTSSDDDGQSATVISPQDHISDYGRPEVVDTSALPSPDVHASAAPQSPISIDPSSPPSAPPQPWSSYLYSFVVPPPRQHPVTTAHPAHAHPVEPSSPTEDQKPVHNDPPPDVNIREAAPVPQTAPEPDPAATPSTATSPIRNADRRPSTTGWLNYLALRASQKKIAGSSVNITESDAKAASGEEVMDFSTDPDFPPAAAPLIQSLAPPQAIKGKDVQVAAEAKSIKSVTPKPSQNLDVKKKRLSNASLVSNGSHTPALVSPKARSSMDSSRPTANGSSLPPPPQTVQPNLVIPTFADTFDRPPRSFLATPSAVPQEHPETSRGITAATTGLAWKALGAVGSYVYGSGDGGQKVTSDTILENEKELRGRKEGRNVGADLPRRIGLGRGSPDDGWRHVKRVVVIGVHGWFPAKMLNSVIGEPTGTSVKFANMMGQAVQQFFHEKGVDDIRLTLMPLEGEGTIESRVDSNPAWINDLRRADAIFFAAHSQGCIVTTHLMSRMIAQGHIRTPLNAEAKVAMLAMCGVHLGPLYSISTSTVIQPYLQWFENAAARELFEFQDSSSAVSVAYQKALSMVLENEVRVVFLASLNDQVVPIYGASFSTATHPLLLRALYVDGASYTQSDFMTNLLCFAFMLKNAGIDDQRLIEHLSEATAGSLTGVGHSTPYEELSTYSLAVQYLFHAGPARHPIPPLEVEPFSARDAKNDFELPWIMRALVDSPEVKDLFPGELRDLKEGILHWRPNTKVLKEIKKRLEPMAGRQSKLRALHTSPSSASLISNGTGDGLGISPGANRALQSGLRKDW
ncbi:hypothetical protein I302_109210 [Kwoniella bestiolae CBS 10118]|uniref:YMC020W-like alpha/beta hydrolase domain-containing protein n=1 Tax=Kwoniella bestiolae CBS 10118 TaxID=1296100 RepID=A0AAJ8KH76_9TREE